MNYDRCLLIALATVFSIYLLLQSSLNEGRSRPARYVIRTISSSNGTAKNDEYDLDSAEYFEEDQENEDNSTESPDFDLFSTCPLTIFDPFHKEIGGTIKYKNPLATCNLRYMPATRLDGKALSIRQHDVKFCRYRCHYYVNVTTYSYDEWKDLSGWEKRNVFCDFVRTQCYNQKNETIDQSLHAQIVETQTSTVAEVNKLPEHYRRPDIHIIVVDSVSSTQARRSLPRTLSFLQNELGAIQFHHLNKVGDNSLPNGYAFLLGWRIVSSKRQSVGADDLEPMYTMAQVCDSYHDNDSVIFRDFERIGYKTMYSEEYIQGSTFTYPKCKGFEKPEANHIFRPFVSTHSQDFKLKAFMSTKNCFEMHSAQLDYHSQFIRSYPGKPKFGLTWIGALAHDDANTLFHTDEHFEKLFKNNAKSLDNAFVFFMGDHGMRVGQTLKTELGKRELSNPMFLILPPKWLRDNQELKKNLERNSGKLLTQFDVHATLLDIFNMTINDDFKDFSEKPIFSREENPNNATSILRPLGGFEKRNCRNIPTDFSYCLCEYKMRDIQDQNLKKALGDFGVNEVNLLLEKSNLFGQCDRWELRTVNSVRVYLPAEKTRLYSIQFTTIQAMAEFKIVVKMDLDGTLKRASDVERLTQFGTQAKCIEATNPDLRHVCRCKNSFFG